MRIPTQRLTGTAGEKVHLTGCAVVQVRFSSKGAAVRLILAAENQPLSDLAIEEEVTLVRDRDRLVLVGARPGRDYNPRELAPLLELLGTQVEHVNVRPGGYLVLAFSNGWTLTVGLTEFGEPGWTLRSGKFISLI